MKAFTPNEARLAVHGRWLSQGADVTIEGVTTDSRSARPGELFVAIKGPTFDGHDYLLAAAKAGCIAAIVDRDAPLTQDVKDIYGGGLIGVEDTVVGLGELAAFYRQQLSVTVVAVTGSNGKTTVKRMIDHILSRRLSGTGSPKSFNNAIGVPLTLLSVEPSHDYVVCEIGANAPGEVLQLGKIAQPNLAVITSVGPAHLEGFGSVERVAVEKASLLASLGRNGLAVICGDHQALERAVVSYDCRKIRFGEGDDCELRLTACETTSDGLRFQINDRQWVELPIPGKHNASNALAAIAVAQRFGLDQAEAADALADFAPAEMRLQREKIGKVTIINDTYNANPASVAAAASVLAETLAKRRVMILGDMRELDDQAEQLHRDLGAQLSRGPVDLLIGVGALGRYIAQGAAEAGVEALQYESVAETERELVSLLKSGDVVLIKGSRAMAMERLIEPVRQAFA